MKINILKYNSIKLLYQCCHIAKNKHVFEWVVFKTIEVHSFAFFDIGVNQFRKMSMSGF